MSEALMLPLEELMAKRAGSVDPSKFPDEQFDLYSIPAFDKGCHEVVAGSEIGSTKQVVEPNDVLLSKIVPHIRRSWVVGQNNGRRMIASGEWIVFRSDKADPAYLRHVLVGDPFHAQFMQTVSGVGGSLLRARPAQVAKIKIPLPPLPEQLRIAAILDQADALRTKRREALAQLDSLTQSILFEVLANSKSLSKVPLESLVSDMHQGINTVTEAIDYKPEGFPIIQSKHTTQGYLDLSDARFVDVQTFEHYREKYKPRKDNLLLCNIGTIGSSIIVKEEIDFLIAWNLFLIKVKPEVAEPVYIKAFLDHLFYAHYFDKFLTGGTVKFISKKTLSETPISLPSAEEQSEFVRKLDEVEQLRDSHLNAIAQLDALFSSLQNRAFRGEL